VGFYPRLKAWAIHLTFLTGFLKAAKRKRDFRISPSQWSFELANGEIVSTIAKDSLCKNSFVNDLAKKNHYYSFSSPFYQRKEQNKDHEKNLPF
jgi:hypothetical protein